MTFDAIYSTAVDVVNRIAAGGEALGPDKTVCVILSGTGRVYYGVSNPEMHAEIDALRNMQGLGETVVSQLILINTADMTALLPCNGCVGFIRSQHPENARCVVAMPDRMIPLSEIGNIMGGAAPAHTTSMALSKNIKANSDLLKGRVSSLMDGLEDDEDDEDDIIKELEKPKKKKLFGLFG